MLPLFVIATVIFMIGFFIGKALFSKSESQIPYAIFFGLAAIIVCAATFYVGCSLIIGNTRP